MAEKFGQITPGAVVTDSNTRQAFEITEEQLQKLFVMIQDNAAIVEKLKNDLSNNISSAIFNQSTTSLTSTSTNSEIVSALEDMSNKLKAL